MANYSLNKGLKQFGSKGYKATMAEIKQLHEREVFKPIDVRTLTPQEKFKAMESLIF